MLPIGRFSSMALSRYFHPRSANQDAPTVGRYGQPDNGRGLLDAGVLLIIQWNRNSRGFPHVRNMND
jgi:hypothetical protein